MSNLNAKSIGTGTVCISEDDLLLFVSENFAETKMGAYVIAEHLNQCRKCRDREGRIRARLQHLLTTVAQMPNWKWLDSEHSVYREKGWLKLKRKGA